MRVLGVDLGERRIGVAISDELCLTAQGLTTLPSMGLKRDVERVAALAALHGARTIVVGLPKNMDGSFGAAAEHARKFADLLGRSTSATVALYDERLSTRVAARVLIEADISRKGRKESIDMLSAQVILQDYLERRRRCVPHAVEGEDKTTGPNSAASVDTAATCAGEYGNRLTRNGVNPLTRKHDHEDTELPEDQEEDIGNGPSSGHSSHYLCSAATIIKGGDNCF